MRIGNFCLWMGAKEAASYGCSHHARIYGLIPGFFGEHEGMPMWVSRSDALNPLEDLIGWISHAVCSARGIEPATPFSVGSEIAA